MKKAITITEKREQERVAFQKGTNAAAAAAATAVTASNARARSTD